MDDTHILWPGFTSLLTVAAHLGQAQNDGKAGIERAALAAYPGASEGFARILTTLAANPEELKKINENGAPALVDLVPGFDSKRYRKALDAMPEELVEIVGRSVDQVGVEIAEKVDEAISKSPSIKGEMETRTRKTDRSTSRGDGSGTDDDDGDDPSDTPPPNVYGEELDDVINGDRAISIHTVKCSDVTGWGPSGQLDDEVAWHCRSRQKFKDIAEPILAEFISQEYEDVSSGDQLSAIDDSRSPMEEGTKIDIYKDDKLCPRLWRPFIVRGRKILAEDNESAFKIADFEHCLIRVTLFEVGESLESIIKDILRLVLHLTGLGVGAGSSLTPAGLIQNALGSAAQTSLVQRSIEQLEEFISELLGSTKDRIGRAHFRVKKSDIESAFSAGTPVATPYGFSYVLGPEQTLTGKDSNYTIQLRYEDHS